MRKPEQQPATPPQSPPAAHEDRLGGLHGIVHDEDERPSREDRVYGETIFNRGVVPLPRFLRRRRPRA